MAATWGKVREPIKPRVAASNLHRPPTAWAAIHFEAIKPNTIAATSPAWLHKVVAKTFRSTRKPVTMKKQGMKKTLPRNSIFSFAEVPRTASLTAMPARKAPSMPSSSRDSASAAPTATMPIMRAKEASSVRPSRLNSHRPDRPSTTTIMKMNRPSSASWIASEAALKPVLCVVTQTASSSRESMSVRMVAPTVTVTGRRRVRPAFCTIG